jgi:hypothetical protein
MVIKPNSAIKICQILPVWGILNNKSSVFLFDPSVEVLEQIKSKIKNREELDIHIITDLETEIKVFICFSDYGVLNNSV